MYSSVTGVLIIYIHDYRSETINADMWKELKRQITVV